MSKRIVYLVLLLFFSNVALAQESCIQKAERLMLQAKKIDATPARWEKEHLALLQEAQNSYLCAAQEGVAFAGYEAVALANQQLANELSPELTNRLLKAAAESGHALAALTLATVYCGRQVTGCESTNNAMPWLNKAIELGNAAAAITAAQIFEYGYGTAINLPKAKGCYLKASALGDSNGSVNVERLSKKGVSTSEECLN